jgi:F-type H+-transporting ATPase subunit epsilon
MGLIVRVLTPAGVVLEGMAQSVILPGHDGQFGVLTGHAPLTTMVEIGVVRIRQQQQWMAIAVSQGFAQIRQDEVIVLVNTAERGDQIDPTIAQADLLQAEEKLHQAHDQRDWIKANLRVRRARARHQAALA